MEQEKSSSRSSDGITYEAIIDMKLPSFNEYINEERTNRFMAAKMKKDLEEQISWFLRRLPHFEKRIKIDFIWIEENNKRDPDNCCFNKKFILDAMVKLGIITNDNRKYVGAFADYFPKPTGESAKVILKISEMDE